MESVSVLHPIQSRHNPPSLQIDFGREGEGARVKDGIHKKKLLGMFFGHSSSIPSSQVLRVHNFIGTFGKGQGKDKQ